jgi:hypothetical protein
MKPEIALRRVLLRSYAFLEKFYTDENIVSA